MKSVLVEYPNVYWDMDKYPCDDYMKPHYRGRRLVLCSLPTIIASVLGLRGATLVSAITENILIAEVPENFDCEEMLQLTALFLLSTEPTQPRPLVLRCLDLPESIKTHQGTTLLSEKCYGGDTNGLAYYLVDIAISYQTQLCPQAFPEHEHQKRIVREYFRASQTIYDAL